MCYITVNRFSFSRLVSALILILGITSSAVCFVSVCTFIHRKGVFVIALPMGVTSLIIALSMAVMRLINRVVHSRGQRLMTRFDTTSLCAIPREADRKKYTVQFARYASVTVVERWHPGLGAEFNHMVARNLTEVQHERFLTKRPSFFTSLSTIPEVEDKQEEDLHTVVVVEKNQTTSVPRRTTKPPAPRRSCRTRKHPERWVPPYECKTKTFPLGTFIENGRRRSSRIAALTANL